MSLGHMTKQEQAITLGGMLVIGMGFMYYVEYESQLALAVIAFGFVSMGILKVWAWSHTEYDAGFHNPQWTRDQNDD